MHLIVYVILVSLIMNLSIPTALFAEEGDPVGAEAGGSPMDDPTLIRDVTLMAVYGTMSGIIVGAATLAFTNRPLTKLRRVAQGASLGLYLGLLLGGLVVLDRYLGAQGSSIFDVPMEEEEIPIVHFKNNKFKLSVPSLYVATSQIDVKSDKMKIDKQTWLGAPIFRLTF
jgi:hypothetical protein